MGLAQNRTQRFWVEIAGVTRDSHQEVRFLKLNVAPLLADNLKSKML